MNLFETIAGTGFFLERRFVARVYADSLRDNFASFTPTDAAAFAQIHADYLKEANSKYPYFAELLRIEASLVGVMPNDVLFSRLWAVEDRFQRVVPASTRASYEQVSPPRTAAIWSSADFVRNQIRTMLDVIHSNYLINAAREASIKRLKIMIFFLFAVCSTTVGLLISLRVFHPFASGLLLIVALGVMGAMLSVSQRLQNAVALDAMAQDGIYELTGLRMGWVGLLMSILLGGAFALVVYVIIQAGLASTLLPAPLLIPPNPGGIGAIATPTPPVAPGQAVAGKDRTVTPGNVAGSEGIAGGAPIPKGVAANTAQQKQPSGSAAVSGAESAPQSLAMDLAATGCPPWALDPADRSNADALSSGKWPGYSPNVMRCSLGFGDKPSFFKMLILALLAGFAERLVPDILSRLSKQPS